MTRPDGTYVLFEFNRTPTTFGVGAKETEMDLRITHSCDDQTPDKVVNHTTRSDTSALGRALPLYQGTWTDPNEISDNQTAEDTGNDPVLGLAAKWSFKRHKASP